MPDTFRNVAVNELVSLKPMAMPMLVTDPLGFARSALARSMRRRV
jgi:hypothetical protein